VWWRNLDKIIHHTNKVHLAVGVLALHLCCNQMRCQNLIHLAGWSCQRVLLDARYVYASQEGVQSHMASACWRHVPIRRLRAVLLDRCKHLLLGHVQVQPYSMSVRVC
jgi:hypothetical protein